MPETGKTRLNVAPRVSGSIGESKMTTPRAIFFGLLLISISSILVAIIISEGRTRTEVRYVNSERTNSENTILSRSNIIDMVLKDNGDVWVSAIIKDEIKVVLCFTESRGNADGSLFLKCKGKL